MFPVQVVSGSEFRPEFVHTRFSLHELKEIFKKFIESYTNNPDQYV
jgi:hypothetical protein